MTENKKLEEILDEYRKDFSNVIGGMRGEILIKQAFAAGQDENAKLLADAIKQIAIQKQKGRQEVFDVWPCSCTTYTNDYHGQDGFIDDYVGETIQCDRCKAKEKFGVK